MHGHLPCIFLNSLAHKLANKIGSTFGKGFDACEDFSVFLRESARGRTPKKSMSAMSLARSSPARDPARHLPPSQMPSCHLPSYHKTQPSSIILTRHHSMSASLSHWGQSSG